MGRLEVVVPTVRIEARPTIHTHSSEKRQLSGHTLEKLEPSRGSGLADRREVVAQVTEAYRTVPPIGGAQEAIRNLLANAYIVAATTGFDREIVMPIFRRLGWEKYFAAIVTSDDVTQGRPAPYLIFHAMEAARVNSVAEVMAVGDTPLDLRAAKNAGVRGMVGVLSGAGTADQLRGEPHTQILSSVAKLPALLGLKEIAR